MRIKVKCPECPSDGEECRYTTFCEITCDMGVINAEVAETDAVKAGYDNLMAHLKSQFIEDLEKALNNDDYPDGVMNAVNEVLKKYKGKK